MAPNLEYSLGISNIFYSYQTIFISSIQNIDVFQYIRKCVTMQYHEEIVDNQKRVVNEAGQVAIHYLQWASDRPRTVGKYSFYPQHSVFLAWVDPQDVPTFLAIVEKSCNCNSSAMKNMFILASLANVNIFYTGGQ